MVIEGTPSKGNIRDIIEGITCDLYRLREEKYIQLTPAWDAREKVLSELNAMLEGKF